MSKKFEPFDWYQSPLYYDIIFDKGTGRESAFLEAMWSLYGLTNSKRRRVLEPACGSGRLLAAMAQRGWEPTGFDLSDGALAFARRRLAEQNLPAALHHAAMQDFDLGQARFDLAHCLVSTFKYLRTEDDARRHLELVARALRPGGVYVLGLHLSDYNITHIARERWVAQRNGTQVVCNIQSWPPDRRTRTEQCRSRMTVTTNGDERRYESYWTFRTYSLDELQSLLRTIPAFEHVATYDFNYTPDYPIDFDGSWEDNVLVLRKK